MGRDHSIRKRLYLSRPAPDVVETRTLVTRYVPTSPSPSPSPSPPPAEAIRPPPVAPALPPIIRVPTPPRAPLPHPPPIPVIYRPDPEPEVIEVIAVEDDHHHHHHHHKRHRSKRRSKSRSSVASRSRSQSHYDHEYDLDRHRDHEYLGLHRDPLQDYNVHHRDHSCRRSHSCPRDHDYHDRFHDRLGLGYRDRQGLDREVYFERDRYIPAPHYSVPAPVPVPVQTAQRYETYRYVDAPRRLPAAGSPSRSPPGRYVSDDRELVHIHDRAREYYER